MLKMTALTERMICMLDVLLDAVLDSLKTLPFLFGAFLLMEAAEKHYGKHMDTILKKSKWGGPLAGSILGCIPQCGFSAAAAGLFAGRIVTPGTLIAVFLSTSDEMLPIMLSEGLPAMMIVDAVSRLIPGVLHNDVSAEFESFQDNLLEYPQYSRPEIWHDRQVPPILLSGHHANVEKWRREQSVIRTAKWRPDLLEDAELTMKERELAEEIIENREKDLKNEE